LVSTFLCETPSNSAYSSSQPKPTTPKSPHTFSYLEKHLSGELPVTPQKASEKAPDLTVSENQQQPNLQMASKTCTYLIIKPDFKPDSRLQSTLETSSTDQSISDTSTSVSEDQTHAVQPINAAQSENTLQTSIDNLLKKP